MKYFVSFWKGIIDFKGLATRKEYWISQLWVCLFTFLAFFLMGIPLPFIALANIALTVRRLHDRGHKGTYYLFVLIPFVGSIMILIEMVQASVPKEDNKYLLQLEQTVNAEDWHYKEVSKGNNGGE